MYYYSKEEGPANKRSVMKKFISLFLVLVLIASLGVTASAKTDGPGISPFYVVEWSVWRQA